MRITAKNKFISFLVLVATTLFKRLQANHLNQILLHKISVEVKNIPLILLGFFIIGATLGIAMFSFVFATVNYIQNPLGASYFNAWIVTSILLTAIAALISIPIYLYVERKSQEVKLIQTVKDPLDAILKGPLAPLFKELQREQKSFVMEFIKPKEDVYLNKKQPPYVIGK